jgi:hypothetical protein
MRWARPKTQRSVAINGVLIRQRIQMELGTIPQINYANRVPLKEINALPNRTGANDEGV